MTENETLLTCLRIVLAARQPVFTSAWIRMAKEAWPKLWPFEQDNLTRHILNKEEKSVEDGMLWRSFIRWAEPRRIDMISHSRAQGHHT